MLTDQERLDVFNILLADHRQLSMGDQDFKLAAIGVTTTGRIYIRENSEQLSTDHNRQCAEQNMEVTAENGENARLKEEAIKNGLDYLRIPKSKPRFKALYLMGGRDGDIPIACPCGNCTDLLSKSMDSDAPVWILPANDGKRALRINATANMANELAGDEAWKTSMGHLKRRPYVTLGETEKVMQVQAFSALSQELSALFEPAVRDEELKKKIRRGEAFAMVDPFPLPDITSEPAETISERANTYLITSIKNTLINRVDGVLQRAIREKKRLPDLSPEGIIALIEKNKISVDAVVMQMEDGSCYANTIGKSKLDNAQQPPEVNVVAMSNEKHGTMGIKQVWGRHFGLKEIEGGVMLTSPSAGVERMVKRRPQHGDETVHFSYAPFNDGTLNSQEIETISHPFTGQELFPGYYTGKASQRKKSDSLEPAVLERAR